MEEALYSKVLGCLGGVMVGDAMGEPFEAPDGVEPRPVPDDALPRRTTDDWQLTAACARSIVRCGGFDLLDVALAHVEELEAETPPLQVEIGWGQSTLEGIADVMEYLDSRGLEGRSPYSPVAPEPGKGRGNGVAMKVAPLVLWSCCCILASDPDPEPHPDRPFFLPGMPDDVMALGAMTHSDRQASIAAYGYSVILGSVILGHPAAVLGSREERASWLLAQSIAQTEPLNDGGDTFSSRMRKLLDFDLLFGDIAALREEVGPGFDAIESVPFSIAVFLRNQEDFRSVVMEAIRSGGDADTVAAMAGAIAGARNGSESIPPEWKGAVPFHGAEVLARAMVDKSHALSRSGSHD